MINKRLSDSSFNEEEFQKAQPLYGNGLRKVAFKLEMKYEKTEMLNNRNRPRFCIVGSMRGAIPLSYSFFGKPPPSNLYHIH